MRLQAEFEMDTDWLVKDYRNIFMALIKNIFMNYDPVLYSYFYGTSEDKRKVNKPFTFLVRFPEYKAMERNRILCGNRVFLFFSSDSEELVIAFYNGLTAKRNIIIGEKFPIAFSLRHIQLLLLETISTNTVVFKTKAPILVNNKGNNLKYLSPTDAEFDRAFKFIIAEQARQFQIPCTENMIHFEILMMKRLPIFHYKQTMVAWLGEFKLMAPSSILQMVYDMGIGVRRSQGFGMLDIIKTY